MAAQPTSIPKPNRSHAERESEINMIAGQSGLVRQLRLTNDTLSRDIYVLQNRIANSLQSMGFTDLDELERTLRQNPSIWNKDSILANASASTRTASNAKKDLPVEFSDSITRDEFEDLRRQVNSLRRPLGASRKANVDIDSPSKVDIQRIDTIGPSPSDEIRQLKKELQVAERMNNALSRSKEALEAKHKADYKKWRSFKRWMMGHSEQAKSLRVKLDGDQVDFSFASSPFPPLTGARNSPKPPSPLAGPSRRQSDEGSLSDSGYFLPRSPSRVVKPGFLERAKPSKRPSSRQKSSGDNEVSLNALYTIDATRNGGVEHQYDEVVRGKERAHLDAGDCDCCEEYYTRLDPVPNRLLPPQWASQALEDNARRGRKTAEKHKKDISRHRHRWTPPETPPDYWNIGFPTTQEVANINDKAAELHAKKRRRIEDEANTEGGRYVRR